MGASSDYFNVEALSKLVRCVTIEKFVADYCSSRAGTGVALCRVALEYNETWSNPRGFELYPDLKSLLHDLEYFALVEAEQGAALGLSPTGASSSPAPLAAELELQMSLARPLRGEREVASQFGSISQPVLALDHAFNMVALPSVFDAGEREALLSALRPCASLRAWLANASTCGSNASAIIALACAKGDLIAATSCTKADICARVTAPSTRVIVTPGGAS